MGDVRRMAEPKVRILADVSIETRDKLEEVIAKLNISKKSFFDTVINEYHERYVKGDRGDGSTDTTG